MSFTDRDYKRLGNAIVKDFNDQGIKLAESIAKVAADQSMNNEEIKRLVETTNTIAHLDLFEKMADGDDRYVTFEAADPDKLIPKEAPTVKAASVEETPLSDFYQPLPDERSHLYVEKLAALDPEIDVQEVLQATSPNTNPYAGSRGMTKIARIQDCEKEIRTNIISAFETYREKMAELVDATRKTAQDNLTYFEKDAFATYGDACREVLDQLEADTRQHFHHTRDQFDTDKHAILDHPLHEKLAAVMTARKDVLKWGQARTYLHEVAGDVLEKR